MREKAQMAKIGVPAGRGHVFVEIPFDSLPMHLIRDVLREKAHRLEWEAEQSLRKLEDVKMILSQL